MSQKRRLWVDECPECGDELKSIMRKFLTLSGKTVPYRVHRCRGCTYVYNPIDRLSGAELAKLLLGDGDERVGDD
jgi:ribosomal protein L34E